jgi:RNA-directed DNA polymerase
MPERANTVHDKTRELQAKLYRAAERSPTRRFHALWDRIHRRDVLERAWREVRANRGAPGVDAQTIAHIEESGVDAFLDELQSELKKERYRPLPVRRVLIPKRDGGQRALGVPAVRDRVVQAATKIVLSPIFESGFLDCSFGFRPGRSAHQAMDRLRHEVNKGRCWAVKADVRRFFDELDHSKLLGFIGERISDRRVLKLISAWLRAGVWEGGVLSRPEAGSPQGGPLSPLLANVYLHRLDQRWREECWRLGVLLRFADDLVVLCPTEERARAALRALEEILASLGLALTEVKVQVVDLRQRGQGFDFLGFHHRKVDSRTRKGRTFCARWPSSQTVRVAKARIRELTAYRLLLLPVADIVGRLNAYLRGWGTYYSRGNSTRVFHDLDRFTTERVARLLSRKHGHPGFGWGLYAMARNDLLGFHQLVGTVRNGPVHASVVKGWG